MFPVQPKPPFGFEDYLMNRRTYILDSNYKNCVVNTQTPTPTNLHKHLKSLFVEQEKERENLRVKVCFQSSFRKKMTINIIL